MSEGRRIVEAARKHKKIVQTGTQSRSATGVRDLIEYVKSGKIGEVTLARALCYKRRPSIGKVDGPQQVPENIDYDLFIVPLEDVDRAVIESEEAGFAKILTQKGKDKILGATIVAPHAGDLLHEFVLAMNAGIGLATIGSTIHAYPTLAELARKAGDKYNRTRLTPTAKKVFTWLYARARK